MPVGGISPPEQILRQIAYSDLTCLHFVPFAVAQTALTVALLATPAWADSGIPQMGPIPLYGRPDGLSGPSQKTGFLCTVAQMGLNGPNFGVGTPEMARFGVSGPQNDPFWTHFGPTFGPFLVGPRSGAGTR